VVFEMVYTIGISSGIFGAVRGAEPRERMESAGISRKIHYSLYKGVMFNQVDLESITEFLEPKLKEHVDAMKRLGVTFGFHGETAAFGGREAIYLDSAIEDEYKRSHERVIISLEHSGKLGAKYYLLHSSETNPFIKLRFTLQPFMLVDVFGRPFDQFLRENLNLLDWVIKQDFIRGVIGYYFDRLATSYVDEIRRKEKREPTEEEINEKMRDTLCEILRSNQETYGAERVAYYIVAKWMEMQKDPLWVKICSKNVEEYEKRTGDKIGDVSMDNPKFRDKENFQLWVPAVSAKYIWGHLNPLSGNGFENPKEILEKYKIYLSFETPMAPVGFEKLVRLARPLHIHFLAEECSSEYVCTAWDFEHILSAYIEPDKEIDALPKNAGERIKIFHLGWPSPLTPAHIPIPLGSDQQMTIYEWLFKLRKKGFKDGFLIFERGGGKDPVQHSIVVLRLIVKYLEKDIHPEKLPDEFFGISPQLPASEKRQWVEIFHHAMDPLKGMLKIPEEQWTFLGTAAKEEGKRPEEWKKEEYR